MDLLRLRGSRRPRQWQPEGADHTATRARDRKVLGRCRLCGRPVRWGQSHHRSGLGLAHLHCERGAKR